MKRLIIVLLAGLAGCSDQPAAIAPQQAQDARVNCINLTEVSARRVLPPSSVQFDMTGGFSYRADLEGRCAERADASTIVQTESQSTRLCRDDRIRIYDPVEARATSPRSFPMCRIVGFTLVPRR